MSAAEGMPASATPAIFAIAANCSGLNMTADELRAANGFLGINTSSEHNTDKPCFFFPSPSEIARSTLSATPKSSVGQSLELE